MIRHAGSLRCLSVAFAAGAAASVAGDSLPRTLLALPQSGLLFGSLALGSLALGFVLSPSVYQRLSRRHPADDPAYAGYAYLECPVCQHVVPLSYDRCPLCGAELLAPWISASRQA